MREADRDEDETSRSTSTPCLCHRHVSPHNCEGPIHKALDRLGTFPAVRRTLALRACAISNSAVRRANWLLVAAVWWAVHETWLKPTHGGRHATGDFLTWLERVSAGTSTTPHRAQRDARRLQVLYGGASAGSGTTQSKIDGCKWTSCRHRRAKGRRAHRR